MLDGRSFENQSRHLKSSQFMSLKAIFIKYFPLQVATLSTIFVQLAAKKTMNYHGHFGYPTPFGSMVIYGFFLFTILQIFGILKREKSVILVI